MPNDQTKDDSGALTVSLTDTRRKLLLNVGCGGTFHRDWLNLDLVSTSPLVKACNLCEGIPLAGDVCDAVYHSHVLEHLTPEEGRTFLEDCFRVLKPGGVLRVVVPDLERIARDYLRDLSGALSGADPFAYDLSVALMYDQTVRNRGGGTLGKLIARSSGPHRAILAERIGDEAVGHGAPTSRNLGLALLRRATRKVHRRALSFLVRIAGGSGPARALEEGMFRQDGEIHRWMYDRFSLGRKLAEVGFVEIAPCRADQSAIERFAEFDLDTRDGRVRKPDSLFMEARKPVKAG